MDPAAIAAGVIATLAPYLAKAAGKFAEGAGQAALDQGGKLFDKLKARFAAAPVEHKQLQDLQAAPQDPLNQMVVQKLLRDALEQDPAFARELAELLQGLTATGPAPQFNVRADSIGSVVNAGSVQTLNIGRGSDKP